MVKHFTIPIYIEKEEAKMLGVREHPEFLQSKKALRGLVLLTYSTVPTDIKGWVVDLRILPTPYDICELATDSDDRSMGWWTGNGWYGRKLKNATVVKWRRVFERN